MDKLSQMVVMGAAGVGKVGESFILMTGASIPLQNQRVVFDEVGNFYLAMRENNNTVLAKFNANLNLEWARRVITTNPKDIAYSDEVLYLLSRVPQTATSILSTVSSTGATLQSGRDISNNVAEGGQIIVDNGIAHIGNGFSTNYAMASLSTSDLTGTPTFVNLMDAAFSVPNQIQIVKVGNNFFQATGFRATQHLSARVQLRRNGAITHVFKDAISTNTNTFRCTIIGFDADAEGNMYVAFTGIVEQAAAPPAFVFVSKINPNNTIAWHRRISSSVSGSVNSGFIKALPSGEIVVASVEFDGSGGPAGGRLVWISSGGGHVRSRLLSFGPTANTTWGIKAEITGKFLVTTGHTTARISGTTGINSFVFSTPLDGSGTGTYSVGGVSVSYTATNYSLLAASVTNVGGSTGVATARNVVSARTVQNAGLTSASLKTNL